MHTQQLKVSGMTCGHCVQHVTDELNAIKGVKDVSVVLNPEDVSHVTVTSDQELEIAALREAIHEAGYEVEE
ncbi:MAG: heavy-metal-associated domain-containing protein [Actinomycetaceae bacterium]|nr:heavy-metal-associated domain-containing protein [Actinomycetaceae bacterium]